MKLHKTLALISLVVAFVFCAGLAAAQDTNTGEPSVIQGLNAPPVEGKAGSVIDPLGIGYDLSPGTGPPPATLGGYTMTPAPHPGAPACTGMTPPIPTSGGGTIGISPWDGLQRCIGSGWGTWSHGYTGDVYFTGGATSQTITLPPGTGAVYFYVEPNPFAVHTFQAVAQPGSVSTGTFTADGSAGATYVGFYDTGGGSITSITITSSADFAVGEFGWAAGGAATWTLDQDVSYASGTLNLNYTIGTPAPSTWATFLILTTPSVQVIPLWGLSIPAIAPPVSVPLSFPFPSVGLIGMLTVLHDGVTAQAVDLDWVDTSGPECTPPPYNPEKWNDGGSIQYNNNCYNFANDEITMTFAQPGRAHGCYPYPLSACYDVHAAAQCDGLVPISSGLDPCPDNMHRVYLVVWPGRDYHWYRQDIPNGMWSHKPGSTPATDRDSSGQLIYNPEQADTGSYTLHCGYLCACGDNADIQ